jgi:hypothetical protein
MKFTLAIAAISSVEAAKVSAEFVERTAVQSLIEEPVVGLSQADPNVKFSPRSVEHCPDFNERFTLVDGKTRAVAYPAKGWNCNADYHLSQGAPAFAPRSVEHCPDFNERMTLVDGRTRAIAYPAKGWNCN